MAKEAATRERIEEEARSGEKYDRPLSAFVVTAVAALILLAAALTLEVVHQYVEWPLGAGDWEIVEVIAIASSILALGIFSLGTWRRLVREITERERAEGALRVANQELRGLTTDLRSANAQLQGEIAEHTRTEEELRESGERLKILFESAPDAYYLNDLRGVFVDGNAAAEEITGYKREELIGKSFLTLRLLVPEEVHKAAATLAKNVAGQPTGPDEFTLNRKDGSQVTVEVRTFPVRISGQTLVLGIARDVTERKRTEETLRKAHDELEIRVQERTAELTSVNERLQLELADRKQAEEALRESEERFRNMFEAAFEGIAIHENGVILDANPAFERMFGYPLPEIIGKSVLVLAAEESRDLIREKVRVHPGVPFEAVGLRKDGSSIHTELVGRDYVYRGRRVRAVAVRDVTERKRMEEALQAARDELEGKVERQLLRRNPYGLTFRELTVLHLVAAGESDKQIGLKLGISHFTAQKHTSNILAKMGAGSRTEATARALREGLLD